MDTIIGPPGTGKTKAIEQLIMNGRDDYIYMTFSVNMAESARARIIDDPDRIGTFHSILSRMMGLENFLAGNDVEEFAKKYRLEAQAWHRFERWYSRTVYSMEKPKNPLNEQLNMIYLYDKYNEYKETLGKIDYTDIIRLATEATLETGHLYIDEAQDLPPLMWKVVDNFNAEKTIAGDPHQSIHSHMGVKVEEFMKRMKNITVLKQSYRYGDNLRKLADRALGNGRLMNIEYSGLKEDTEIQKHTLVSFLGLNGSKAILCRSNSLARKIAGMVDAVVKPINPEHEYYLGWTDRVFRLAGIIKKLPSISKDEEKYMQKYSSGYKNTTLFNYSSYDYGLKLPKREKENVIRLIRKGLPEVYVDTMHSAKGLEFDHVYIFLDMPLPYSHATEEKRVIYTGITRARKSLDYGYNGFYKTRYTV
jgi:superfamily I DNA/RNA helicase